MFDLFSCQNIYVVMYQDFGMGAFILILRIAIQLFIWHSFGLTLALPALRFKN
jgi:hypothetical protein